MHTFQKHDWIDSVSIFATIKFGKFRDYSLWKMCVKSALAAVAAEAQNRFDDDMVNFFILINEIVILL